MKTQKNRNYNVFFNTHTVTGIIISVGLFVCFFAGAFALFMHNIDNWERNRKNEAYDPSIDYEKVLTVTENEGYNLDGRTIFIRYREGDKPYIQVNAPARIVRNGSGTEQNKKKSKTDSLANANIFLRIDASTYAPMPKKVGGKTHGLGNFLYGLHYFEQIPNIGFYLSALISLFFLFAIVTGTIVHWKKIISNFFTFRLRSSLKNLWTDAHTALGIIGLPFQFMYAVTGAFFGLALLLFIPTVMVVYDGDQRQLMDTVRPWRMTYKVIDEPLLKRQDINNLVDASLEHFGRENLTGLMVHVYAYNDQNAHLTINIDKKRTKGFFSNGYMTYRLSDGEIVASKGLDDNTYANGVIKVLTNLHFAHFGGYLVKALYFILALITCFVILSGVMVWLEARNTKKYEHQKRFNTNVGAIYLGASLGLLPAIALFFGMTKVFPLEMENRFDTMSIVFFLFWLTYTVYAFFIKSPYRINKHALLLTGILGLLVPIFNGLQSGLWFWKSLQMGYSDSFFVDMGWLVMGTISLWVGLKVKCLVARKKPKKQNAEQQALETL